MVVLFLLLFACVLAKETQTALHARCTQTCAKHSNVPQCWKACTAQTSPVRSHARIVQSPRVVVDPLLNNTVCVTGTTTQCHYRALESSSAAPMLVGLIGVLLLIGAVA